MEQEKGKEVDDDLHENMGSSNEKKANLEGQYERNQMMRLDRRPPVIRSDYACQCTPTAVSGIIGHLIFL